jgi:RNA polymerase sigma factor FliA
MTAETELGDEHALWQRYVEVRSADDRESLVERYTPLAGRLAGHFYAGRQVFEIEYEEFRQYALLGLVEAIDRYDPNRGAAFATYASHRIRGAILNGIEKHCERQQQISARSRLRQERFEGLLKDAAAAQQDAFARMVDVAIGVAIGYMLEDSNMYRGDDEAYDHNVYRSREVRDLARVLDNLVGTLPEQEQSVIRYHYYQHIRFDQIAENMGLSKGRISQIHHSALRRMKDHYEQLHLLRTDY